MMIHLHLNHFFLSCLKHFCNIESKMYLIRKWRREEQLHTFSQNVALSWLWNWRQQNERKGKGCMCVAAGILAAFLRVAQWVVILLASLCDSSWACRASCDELAEFPCSLQGQRINHRRPNTVWHTHMPVHAYAHTHTCPPSHTHTATNFVKITQILPFSVTLPPIHEWENLFSAGMEYKKC